MTETNYPARMAKFDGIRSEHGLVAAVLTRQASLSYLTGAFLPWRSAVVLVDGQTRLLVWEHDSERAKSETWIREEDIETYSREEGFAEGLRRVLSTFGIGDGRLGMELGQANTSQLPPGAVTAAEFIALTHELGFEIVDVLDAADLIMLLKEDVEIKALRRACDIAGHGFSAGLHSVGPGVLETHIAGVIEGSTRNAGNEWTWSVTAGTEVASGARTAFRGGVTQPAMRRPMQDGDNVILDIHTMYDLYLADLAGNVVIGTPSPEQHRLRDAWKSSLDMLLETIRPGAKIGDVAGAAYANMLEHGFGDVRLPLFGHGLGTCARTPPKIAPGNQERFQENMVMALGVHLYQPGVGGMRTELPTLVTKDGCEPLNVDVLDWHVI